MAAIARGARATSAPLWFITRKHPPSIGGMERLSHELTTRMSRRRPTKLIAMRRPGWYLPVFLCVAASRLLVGCAMRRVALVHLSDGVLAPLALVARAFGVPVTVTLHGLDVVYRGTFYRVWRRLFLRDFDAYVCNSEATRDAALAAGLPGDRLAVIRIAIDAVAAAASPMPRDANRLLFVGRLVRRKGLAWFVAEVLPALAARRPDLKLVVLGDGPQRGAVIAAARAAAVEDRLVWPASRDDGTKASWLERAALCVMPNVSVAGDMEGFGIVALEAAAAGCPVLAADIEGLPEAVARGRAGRLVRSGDARAWIRAIDECLDDPAASRRAGDDARRYVIEASGWDGMIDRYERLFARLASSRADTGATDG